MFGQSTGAAPCPQSLSPRSLNLNGSRARAAFRTVPPTRLGCHIAALAAADAAAQKWRCRRLHPQCSLSSCLPTPPPPPPPPHPLCGQEEEATARGRERESRDQRGGNKREGAAEQLPENRQQDCSYIGWIDRLGAPSPEISGVANQIDAHIHTHAPSRLRMYTRTHTHSSHHPQRDACSVLLVGQKPLSAASVAGHDKTALKQKQRMTRS